jgi:hypothetical protein
MLPDFMYEPDELADIRSGELQELLMLNETEGIDVEIAILMQEDFLL